MQQHSILLFFLILAGIAAFVFAFVFISSLNAKAEEPGMTYPLKKRFWFSLILVVVLGIFATATIPKSPYFLFADEMPAKVIHVAAAQFSFYLSEKAIDPENPSEEDIELPANQLVEFRVTSLDVNHGFAIYDSSMRLITQVQAMPGYVNRLRHKFTKPGAYSILCLEYCGMGHPMMETSFTVK